MEMITSKGSNQRFEKIVPKEVENQNNDKTSKRFSIFEPSSTGKSILVIMFPFENLCFELKFDF